MMPVEHCVQFWAQLFQTDSPLLKMRQGNTKNAQERVRNT